MISVRGGSNTMTVTAQVPPESVDVQDIRGNHSVVPVGTKDCGGSTAAPPGSQQLNPVCGGSIVTTAATQGGINHTAEDPKGAEHLDAELQNMSPVGGGSWKHSRCFSNCCTDRKFLGSLITARGLWYIVFGPLPMAGLRPDPE